MMLSLKMYASRIADTIQIHFNLNEYRLRSSEIAILDSLLYNDIISSRTDILLIGYTDYLGSEQHNATLSINRAKTIQQYLQSMSIDTSNIKLCIGKGEIARDVQTADGYPIDRKVDIVIYKLNGKQKQVTKAKPTIKSPQATTIQTASVGETIRLSNIYFYTGRAIVTNESYPQLNVLFETLDNNPTLKVRIEGHVCCLTYGFDAEDEDTHEIKLSVNRAKFIYDYLVKKGIEKDRLEYAGFGRSKPLVHPEKSLEDQEKNRRVEIRIIEK
ncbi:MAG: OmpA family protein [Bacteroidetes bacterium]|nr:OmpA family protein [Bacteroidota bacterium]